MWGAIIGGALGLMGANKQAGAIDRANEANNQYLNAAMPYIKDNLSNASDAFNTMVKAGPYTGAFTAGVNDMMTNANNALYNTGMNNADLGKAITNASSGFANNANSLYSNFGDIANMYGDRLGMADSLYNKNLGLADDYSGIRDQVGGYTGAYDNLASQSGALTNQFKDMANSALNRDRLSDANSYALNNASPLVDAMLRDDRRNLEESTLTGINMAASGSGNSNASRAGVASAIANRSFDDRRADVTASVVDQLRNSKLNQDNLAYNDSMNALTNAANNMNNTSGFVGGAVNNLLNTGNLTSNMGSAYNAAGNSYSLGNNALAGMNNSYSNAGSANNALANAFNTGINTSTSGINSALNAGTNVYNWDNNQLAADRNQYDYLNGFQYNAAKDFGSFLTNSNPGSGSYMVNNVSPGGAALGGAMAGMGFMNQYGNQIGNSSIFNPLFGGSGLGLGGFGG